MASDAPQTTDIPTPDEGEAPRESDAEVTAHVAPSVTGAGSGQPSRDTVRRRTARQFGAAAASAIARSDMTLDEIGQAIGRDGKHIRRCLLRMIEGRQFALSDFSDIIYGAQCEADFIVRPRVQMEPING